MTGMSRFAPGRRKFTVEKRLDSTEKEIEDATGEVHRYKRKYKVKTGELK